MPHSLGGSEQTLMEEESIEEVVTTRKYRGWKSMPYILGNETAEKIATYGLTTNLIVYLVDYYNMGQLKATNLTNIFSGFTNFSPLVGAFLSDAYLGRFRTIACGSFASLLGMVVITLSASIPHLKPPSCSDLDQQAGNCAGPSTLQLGILYISLALLVIGSGGVRPCSLPFGMDQFDQTTEKGRRGLNSYFNWYYATTCAAIVVALTIIVYIQESISWPIGFGIPAACMVISIIFFYMGTSLYVHVPPKGSAFSGIAQVCVAAILKRKLNLPYPDDVLQQESVLYNPPKSQGTFKMRLCSQFKFLNKAAIVSDNELNSDGYAKNPWKLSSVQQVEELKCLIRIIPLWISGIIFFVVVTQLWNFSILQSLTMDRHLGSHFEVPAVSVGAIAYLALTLFVPIYDWILVPTARRITKVESGITTLQRQGVGFLIAAIAMVVGALVEHKRRESALSHGGMSPISTFLLAPQLILLGIAEAFNAIGQMEFYNLQFPEHMQTVASAVFYCNQGISNYLSNAVVSVVNNITSKDGKTAWLNDNINIGKVDYFYYAVGIMGMVGLLYFLICAHFYKYKSMQSVEEEEESSNVSV